jgi:hypoxanthine phosphoribosyltransferase
MPSPSEFDLIINAESFTEESLASIVESAAAARALVENGFLSPAADAQIQFQMRLQLARHGMSPAGTATLKRTEFNHPSEELFANLLDFYRIEWEYEPRSFPLQWDKDGKVIEAFTPDFYLPEFDLYLELTTMKQALVTKKNRKVKLLKAIYPHINIQVFYQKDLQDLVFKYGLSDRVQTS